MSQVLNSILKRKSMLNIIKPVNKIETFVFFKILVGF